MKTMTERKQGVQCLLVAIAEKAVLPKRPVLFTKLTIGQWSVVQHKIYANTDINTDTDTDTNANANTDGNTDANQDYCNPSDQCCLQRRSLVSGSSQN